MREKGIVDELSEKLGNLDMNTGAIPVEGNFTLHS